MLTPSQRTRLLKISDSLYRAKNSPSLEYQFKMRNWPATELRSASDYLNKLAEGDDGHEAHMIIGAWHEGGDSKVMEILKNELKVEL